MPSIGDVFDQLKDINTNLQTVQGQLTQMDATINTGFSSLLQGQQMLISLGVYADDALSHLTKQEDTVICILEQISEQTCALLNEAHIQTHLQKSIGKSASTLLALYESVNSGAALEFERLEKIRLQVLECCPPQEPEPTCTHRPCPSPLPLREPPDVETPIL